MKTRLLLLILIALVAVGCSAFFGLNESESSRYDDKAPSAPTLPADSTIRTKKNEEFRDTSGSSDSPSESSREVMLVEEPMLVDAIDSDGYASDEVEYEYAEGDAIGGRVESTTLESLAPDNQQVTTLKAGEIDDNAEWDEYLLYRRDSLDNFSDWVHDVDVSGRQIIKVVDAQGLPILGATVAIFAEGKLISQTRTYADGQTLFFPNANPEHQNLKEFTVTITKGNQSATFDMNLLRFGPRWEFTLDAQLSRDTVKLDLVFLLDATGSMSDEIAQLQNNILSISQQIDSMGDVDVRYGLVHYRDRGDDAYITQVFDFTPDVTAFQSELNRVRADGGGDTPESLNAGLHDALQTVEWRGDDTIKLVFLVADAPPHLDYPDDADYAEEMLVAAERGIKIHPIASSGLDAVGEYIFRQIGQTTMGRFIFLTYDDGTPGTAGDERTDLDAGSQDYTVDFLDGLVVRLVEDEINAFKGEIEE